MIRICSSGQDFSRRSWRGKAASITRIESTEPGAVAAKKAAATTPVVFLGVTDPIGSGVVDSLARPGGNLTGTSLVIGEELPAKWVELVRDVLPGVSSVAALERVERLAILAPAVISVAGNTIKEGKAAKLQSWR
jgi:hypothetical protein